MNQFLKNFGIIIVVFLCFFLLTQGLVVAGDDSLDKYYEAKDKERDYSIVKAKVLDIPYDDTQIDKPNIPRVSDIRYQYLKLELISGEHNGERFTVKNIIEMVNPYKLIVDKGDIIILRQYENEAGDVSNLVVYERSKEIYLYIIIIIFILLLLLIGGIKGLKSVVTLGLTVSMLIFILFPLILKGWNPVVVSTLVSIVIAAMTLLIIGGYNRKTLNALLGTLSGLLVAGVLSLVIGNLCKLTGLGNENAQLLAYIPKHMYLDYKGLLFAGIIIGALGAVMDVTMSIASAMWEIVQLQPKITVKTLIKSGMNIGKDVMGSMSNTLILAYVSGSIHIMLLFMAFHIPMLEIVNMDYIASEVIRAIAGSIGLVCSVPMTSLLGGLLYKTE